MGGPGGSLGRAGRFRQGRSLVIPARTASRATAGVRRAVGPESHRPVHPGAAGGGGPGTVPESPPDHAVAPPQPGSSGPASLTGRRRRFPCGHSPRRLRAARGALVGFAPLRRAVGPALAGRGPLRRLRRVLRRTPADLDVPRLGGPVPESRPAVRPVHHPAVGRRPDSGCFQETDRRHRIPPEYPPEPGGGH